VRVLLSGMDDAASRDFALAAACLKHSLVGDFLRQAAASVAEFAGERRFDVRR